METPRQITQKAIDQVQQNNLQYFNEVLNFASDWVKTKFKAFSSEDLKKDYYSLGNQEPIEPRVYGAVFRALSKQGLILKNGFELSKNPICHCRPQQLWISKEYSELQSKKRLSENTEKIRNEAKKQLNLQL